MSPEIKFCGMTRAEDALEAARLGASYVGVIFAGGPRQLTVARAADVLRDVPASVRRVGVFADQEASEIARIVNALGLEVVQLHAGADVERLRAVRAAVDTALWAVVRVAGVELPAQTLALADEADAIHLDAYVPGALGGTGVALPWARLGDAIQPLRARTRLVLAGGLRPENVCDAMAALAPDVVDVASGVEAAPGIKDHERMRAFRDAVTTISHTL